jgi:hypothetical protein
MKKIFLAAIAAFIAITTQAQLPKTELYDLIKKFLYDSTGYENAGDWAVGQPKKFPVKWKEDKITISDDTAINFYRLGNADITLKGKSFAQPLNKPANWTIMLKGPRMGYTSFSIISSPSKDLATKYTIDSLFGNKPFTAKLLKSCDAKDLTGYYYYEVKLPKKDVAFIKFSWLSVNGNTAIRIDCYDSWSKYAIKLDCAK